MTHEVKKEKTLLFSPITVHDTKRHNIWRHTANMYKIKTEFDNDTDLFILQIYKYIYSKKNIDGFVYTINVSPTDPTVGIVTDRKITFKSIKLFLKNKFKNIMEDFNNGKWTI